MNRLFENEKLETKKKSLQTKLVIHSFHLENDFWIKYIPRY